MKKEKIYDTENKDILIFDWQIGRVLEYLEDNGIAHKPHKAYKYGTTKWVFVNLNGRTYTRGVGGIQTGRPLNGHAITFDEFKMSMPSMLGRKYSHSIVKGSIWRSQRAD